MGIFSKKNNKNNSDVEKKDNNKQRYDAAFSFRGNGASSYNGGYSFHRKPSKAEAKRLKDSVKKSGTRAGEIMGFIDRATYDLDGIAFIFRGLTSGMLSDYRTRIFTNPVDGKGMYVEAGRDDETSQWAYVKIRYAGADMAVRETSNVYTDEDVLAYIHDFERDELAGQTIRSLLE